MKCNFFGMWIFSIPLAFISAFLLDAPVLLGFAILNLDEIVKSPAVYFHYKKYIWLKNITRE